MDHSLQNLGFLYKQLIGPDFLNFETINGQGVLTVYSASIQRVLTLLFNHQHCDFKQLVDITAIDYLKQNQKFEVVYHILSHQCNQRLRIKLHIPEGVAVPTATRVFKNANWYEREIWDLFGIVFTDHPNLRRILTDYTFSGHPLRKDFPLTGYTQVRFDEKQQKVVYEKITLDQAYRSFDFLSPWEGLLNNNQLQDQNTTNQGDQIHDL